MLRQKTENSQTESYVLRLPNLIPESLATGFFFYKFLHVFSSIGRRGFEKIPVPLVTAALSTTKPTFDVSTLPTRRPSSVGRSRATSDGRESTDKQFGQGLEIRGGGRRAMSTMTVSPVFAAAVDAGRVVRSRPRRAENAWCTMTFYGKKWGKKNHQQDPHPTLL